MTQTMNPESATPEEVPRCYYGSGTDSPCPREATVAVGTGFSMCAEHAAAREIQLEEDDWLEALYYLRKWLDKARKKTGGTSALTKVLESAREEAERGYEDALKRIDAAHEVASYYEDSD